MNRYKIELLQLLGSMGKQKFLRRKIDFKEPYLLLEMTASEMCLYFVNILIFITS